MGGPHADCAIDGYCVTDDYCAIDGCCVTDARYVVDIHETAADIRDSDK